MSAMNILEFLSFAKEHGASDLHLSAGAPPMVRIGGRMRKLKFPDLSKEEVHRLIFDVLTDEQRGRLEENREIDFSRDVGEIGRFRINAFYQDRGEAAVFRTIPTEIPSFEALGLPEVMRGLALKEKGLILVTGPTGSGKSTTLAALIDLINETEEKHIITIEDPIEFVHSNKKCMINQRELGKDTHSFANALKSALREDPDVILVGEMRDPETIHLALTAAETGHLVFATLHTSGAARTANRIIDVFPAQEQAQVRTMFAESMLAVVSQVLLRRRKEPGRVAAFEILVATVAVRSLIREGKIHQIPAIMETGRKFGMQILDRALEELVVEGVVDREEAAKYRLNPDRREEDKGFSDQKAVGWTR